MSRKKQMLQNYYSIFNKGRSRAEAALQYKQKDEEKGPHQSKKHFIDK